VRPEHLRTALLQHTAESLAVLCEDTEATWCIRSGGYSPRFTFRTSELLPRWFGTVHGQPQRSITEVLAPFAEAASGEWGGVFVRSRSQAMPLPVAVRGELPDKSTSLLRVGKWAASALDLAATFQDENALVSAMEPGGSCLVAWRHGSLLVAGRMDGQGPARVLNHRAAARRKG
jgi:hypothetical protein